MQSMMGAYVEQSAKMFQQMQDSMQEQTRKLFTGFQFPGYPRPAGQGHRKEVVGSAAQARRRRASVSFRSAARRRRSTPSRS